MLDVAHDTPSAASPKPSDVALQQVSRTATEWDIGGQEANRLSGNDILEAKAWAARRPKSAPEPTALQFDFIRASEQEAEARSNAQRQQLEAMAAAQSDRETALHEAEEALQRAADAQRKRARNRNIALFIRLFLPCSLVGSGGTPSSSDAKPRSLSPAHTFISQSHAWKRTSHLRRSLTPRGPLPSIPTVMRPEH